MNQESADKSDQITVLVFKDNYAARTFQIRPSWISKLGIILIFIVSLTVLSTYFALKFYHLASKLDPTRILDLEQEIKELKSNLKLHDSKSASAFPTNQVNSMPTHTPTPLAPTSEAQVPSNSTFQNSVLPLALFPKEVRGQLPDSVSLPFSIQAPKAIWKGKALKVSFAIQYNQKEGNQQGRIVITVKGPGKFLTYPSDTLTPGSEYLITPSKGEYFSVSHYREVVAEFGPFQKASELEYVEIYIFNEEGQILTYNKFEPQTAPSGRREKPKAESDTSPPPSEPSPTSQTDSSTQPEGSSTTSENSPASPDVSSEGDRT